MAFEYNLVTLYLVCKKSALFSPKISSVTTGEKKIKQPSNQDSPFENAH